MKKLALLVCLATFLNQGYSQIARDGNWIYIGDGKINYRFYFRAEYVSKVGHEIKIWTKNDCPSLTLANKKTYNNAVILSLYLVDCSLRRTKHLAFVIYDSDKKVIDQSNKEDDKWSDVIPESLIEKLVFDICKYFK